MTVPNFMSKPGSYQDLRMTILTYAASNRSEQINSIYVQWIYVLFYMQ